MVNVPDNDDATIDTFSGATVRTQNLRQGGSSKFDLTGYSFAMYNVPRAVPKPLFETVYNGENSFKLNANGIAGGTTVDAVKVILPDERVLYFESEIIEGQEGENFKLKINENEGQEGVAPSYRDPRPEEIIGKMEYKKEGDNEYFVFTYTGADTFATKNIIQALYYKGGLENNNTGDLGSTVVEALPTNASVDDLKQLPNPNENAAEGTDVLVSARIKEQPVIGTVYKLVKEDGTPIKDSDGNEITYVS